MKRVFLIVIASIFGFGGEFSLIGTADLQGVLEPTVKKNQKVGGIAQIAYEIRKIKNTKSNVLALSAGDDLMGVYFATFKGEAIFKLLSLAGYDILAFGNHEFDKGSKVLAKALEGASFDALCSDLNTSKSPLRGKCLEYKIVDFKEFRVGFFSLMTEDFSNITSAKDIKLKANNITFAKEIVKRLKKEADIVVAITHIGEKEDIKLAKAVKGIDIIFGGHSHNITKNPLIINNTVVVNGGEKGEYLLELNLKIKNKRLDLNNTKFTLHKISNTPALKEVKEKLNSYKKLLPKTLILGKRDRAWDLRSSTIRFRESPFCDMVNDIIKDNFKVDIVLNNSGTFRGKGVYKAGDITSKDLREIDAFGNNLIKFKIKGKYIKEILNHSASSLGKGGFLQISGLRVVIENKRLKDVKVVKNGELKELEPKKYYSVVTNSFLFNGGDGYFWFKKYAKDITNSYTTIYSILSQYLLKYKNLTPKVDGRLITK